MECKECSSWLCKSTAGDGMGISPLLNGVLAVRLFSLSVLQENNGRKQPAFCAVVVSVWATVRLERRRGFEIRTRDLMFGGNSSGPFLCSFDLILFFLSIHDGAPLQMWRKVFKHEDPPPPPPQWDLHVADISQTSMLPMTETCFSLICNHVRSAITWLECFQPFEPADAGMSDRRRAWWVSAARSVTPDPGHLRQCCCQLQDLLDWVRDPLKIRPLSSRWPRTKRKQPLKTSATDVYMETDTTSQVSAPKMSDQRRLDTPPKRLWWSHPPFLKPWQSGALLQTIHRWEVTWFWWEINLGLAVSQLIPTSFGESSTWMQITGQLHVSAPPAGPRRPASVFRGGFWSPECWTLDHSTTVLLRSSVDASLRRLDENYSSKA